jgi:hypothetical protein
MYLKLAIPGLLTLLIEWSSFQMGIFAAASIDKEQLDLMSIAQQVISISYQFPFGIGKERHHLISSKTIMVSLFCFMKL